MTIDVLEHEIQRFLSSTRPEIMCIHGDWGVGKTFAWKKYLKEAADNSRIGVSSYSYVSVFGISNLNDVKREIFRNTVGTEDIGALPDERSMGGQISAVLESSKSHLSAIGSVFGGKGTAVAGLIEELSFAAIKQRLICFDDLERAGKGLEIKDVLGLASFLKDERQCKVAVLLNDEKIEGNGRSQFQSQFEKLFDSHVRFDPSPSESVTIAIENTESYYNDLLGVVAKLGLNNIRIIRKIERVVRQIREVPELPEEAMRQTVWTAAIASWSRYRPEEAIPMTELENYNSYSIAFELHGDKEKPAPPWYDRLEKTGYSSTDAFDRAVIACVVDGFASSADLITGWKATEAGRRVSLENPAYKDAWDAFHTRTTLSDDEIAQRLEDAIRADPRSITISSMSSTSMFLRKIGKDDLADRLLEFFLTERKFKPSDLDDDVFAGRFEKTDPRIVEHFERLKAEFVDERNPKDVLEKIAVQEGWSPKDIQLLSKLRPEELVDVIDELQGENLKAVLKMCARFHRAKEPDYAAFGASLGGAFRILAARSKTNEFKLSQFGISFEENEPQVAEEAELADPSSAATDPE